MTWFQGGGGMRGSWMSRLLASLALVLTLGAYGAVIASRGQEQGSSKPSRVLEDEPGFNCMTQGNFRCGPNPDLEDRR